MCRVLFGGQTIAKQLYRLCNVCYGKDDVGLISNLDLISLFIASYGACGAHGVVGARGVFGADRLCIFQKIIGSIREHNLKRE